MNAVTTNSFFTALDSLTKSIGAMPATAAAIVVGALLVFFGRKLFWIFVAGMGFLAGLEFAPQLVPNQPDSIILIIGIVLGLIGAVLSIFLQRLAVAIAGGYAGGVLASRLAAEFGWSASAPHIAIFLVGAIIAALIVSALYDWALILLTAISGAFLVCDGITLAPNIEWVIAIVLIVLGGVVQARMLRGPAARAV